MTPDYPRVALVAASLDILGGQGVQAQSLVSSLRDDRVDVTFIPINPRFPRGLRWLRRVPYVRTLINQALYLPSLAAVTSVDVVHVFSASYLSFLLAPVPAMIAARAARKRVILHYHSGEAADHLATWGCLVHPWLRLPDAIVVPSRYLAEVFANHGYTASVISNVVDLSRFTYRERTPGGLRLLSARNLEQYYRIDVILDAFAQVKARHPHATLTVAGCGSQENALRARACDGVRFVGAVRPEAMPALYASADMLLNASEVDNQPVTILEAFASGLPVVTTAAGDIPSLVGHRHTGMIVPFNDPATMAAAVEGLALDHALARRVAMNAHAHAGRFTWAAVRDEWRAFHSGTPHRASSTGSSPHPQSWTLPHRSH
jgi:L-malate glycosyltransferase